MTAPANTRTQVRALLWEEGRVGGAIAAACAVVGWALLSMYYRVPNAWTRDEFTTHFGALGVPILAAFLLILNPDTSGHLVGGFSKRVLRLPVQTSVAVAVALCARTVFVFFVSAILVGYAAILFDDTPGLAAAGHITLLYLIAQLIDWLRGPINGLSSLIVVGVVGTIVYALWPGTPELAPIAWGLSIAGRSPLILPLAVLAAAALAYGISVVAVHADRVGRRFGVPEIWEWPRRIRVSGRTRTTPFRSPMAAQVWFELRRAKWSLPLGAGLLFAIWLIAAWIAIYSDRNDGGDESALRLAVSIGLFACVLVGAGIHGVLTRVLGFRKPAGKSGYEYLQPLTDAQFATARVAAGAVVLLPTLLGALAIHFAYAGRLFLTEMLPEGLNQGFSSPREAAWMLLSRGLLIGLLAWSLLAIGTRTFRWLIGLLSGIVLIAAPMGEKFDAIFRTDATGWVFTALLVASVALTLGMFAVAWRRALCSSGVALGWVTAWLALAWMFRYALITAWAPEVVPLGRQISIAVNALGCGAMLPLVYLALLFDLHRRRRGATVPQDPEQHRAMGNAILHARNSLPRRVFAAIAVAAAIWLGWPADPALVSFRRSRGEPVTLSDLNAWYAEPPTGENVAPEYLRVGTLAVSLRRALEKKRQDHYLKASEALDFAQNNLLVVGGARLPRAGAIEKAAWDATEAYWAEVTAQIAPELKALAARGTGGSRYPIDFAADEYYQMSNHIRISQNSGAELALDALHWTIAGRPGDAADSVLAMLALSHTLMDEPALWAQHTRMNLLEVASHSIERLLNRSVPGEAELERLQRGFAEAAAAQQESSSSERAIVGATTIQLSPQSDYNYHASLDPRRPTTLLLNLAYPAAGARLTTLFEAQTETKLLRQPWSEVQASYEEADATGYYLQFAFMLPSLSGYLSNYRWTAEIERRAFVELGLAQTALSIERFRAGQQRLPKDLAELVPAYLSEIPADAFAASPGAPLRYLVRESGEYVVYSVGYDMDDDGGETLRRQNRDHDIALTVAPMALRTGPQIAAE